MTDKIEWVKELPEKHGGRGNRIAIEVLDRRPGVWAILRAYAKKKNATSMASQLAERYPNYEFAGRSNVNGKAGSVLYGRKKK